MNIERVCIVAGGDAVGKTSTINYIIGKIDKKNGLGSDKDGKGRRKKIKTKNGDLYAFCRSKSLQESGKMPEEFYNIDGFASVELSVSIIIIALRTDNYKPPRCKKELPEIEKYVEYFVERYSSCEVKVVELFGRGEKLSTTFESYCKEKKYKYEQFSFNQSFNKSLGDDVKEFFGF